MTTQLDSATAAKRSQLLKVSDVAQLLNVKPRTIYEMVAQHRIPYRKPPGTNLLRFGEHRRDARAAGDVLERRDAAVVGRGDDQAAPPELEVEQLVELPPRLGHEVEPR